MKKFNPVLIILPLAFTLMACGKASDTSLDGSATSINNAVASAPNPGSSGSGGPTTNPTPTVTPTPVVTPPAIGTSGCPAYPQSDYYSGYATGSGNLSNSNTAMAPSNYAVANISSQIIA